MLNLDPALAEGKMTSCSPTGIQIARLFSHEFCSCGAVFLGVGYELVLLASADKPQVNSAPCPAGWKPWDRRSAAPLLHDCLRATRANTNPRTSDAMLIPAAAFSGAVRPYRTATVCSPGGT